MSAFQSRGDSRSGRGRGRPRGNPKSRDFKTETNTFNGQQNPSFISASNALSPQSKPLPKQPRIRNKQWRNSNATSTSSRDNASNRTQASTSESLKVPDQSWRDPANEPSSSYQKHMSELYQQLKKNREKERKDAIKNGFLSDPDRPTSLANAITPVGTCQDMCPEFERVERIVQLMVDGSEKTTMISNTKVPSEELMVKRFRRSAAGYDEQLPSDIRPPLVLQKTLNYLFNEVIGGSQPLGTVHKFVWDRTRGIRNDFSIQQVTKLEDLKIAIDCFERIARFHILSLHQLSRTDVDTGEFDHHQEREQLNNTLLSLMYYYDDSRQILTSPNEAEFRAYCIIFEIQDQRPDLEDRAQNWPRSLLKDPRIQTALKLYAAAGSIADDQGPLRPRTRFSIAQANPGRFWALVQSSNVTYLMACVAEIYFNLVRSTALESIWKAYKGKRGGPLKMEDWVLEDLRVALGFDDEDQTQKFCEDYGLTIAEKESGGVYVDLGSVSGRYLSDSNPRRKQIFSNTLVEFKRSNLSFSAVIDGSLVSESQIVTGDSSGAENSSHSDHESLFITGNSDDESIKDSRITKSPASLNGLLHPTNKQSPSANSSDPTPSLNGAADVKAPFSANTGLFGKPTPPISSMPHPDTSSYTATPSKPLSNGLTPLGQQPPKFNFFPPSTTAETATSSSTSISSLPATQSPFDNLPKSSDNLPSQPQKSLFSSKFPPTLNSTTNSLPSPPVYEAPKATDNSNNKILPQFADIRNDSTSNAAFSPFQNPKAPSVLPQFPTATSTTPAPSLSTSFSSSPSFTNLPQKPATVNSRPFSTFFPKASQASQSMPSTATTLMTPSFTSFSKDSSSDGALNLTSPPNLPPAGKVEATSTSKKINLQEPSTALEFATTKPTVSHPVLNPFNPTPSPVLQAKVSPPKPDPRPAALSSLANSMMLDNAGLLDQFLEYTFGPIIQDSIRQVEDEKSWDTARKCRSILLSKKYFKKWRANAWKKGLLRKGRERRKNFAKSLRDMSRSARVQQQAQNHQFSQSAEEAQDKFLHSTMPPPSSTTQRKRKSLPPDLDYYPQDGHMTPVNKRKRHNQTTISETPSTRHSTASHKRPRTLGNNTPSIMPRSSISSRPFRLDASHLEDGVFISHSVMQRARNLIGRPKLDTTRTDYFALKSRGIDPDTPLVPLTKRKRPSEDAQTKSKKIPRLSPPEPSNSPRDSSLLPNPASKDDLDSHEALIAQIRQVREAMAESIAWFREERTKYELTTASSSRRRETEKEKRLREFKFTPSRTERRLRATGANGFLPKNWDGFQSVTNRREVSEESGNNYENKSPRESQLDEGGYSESLPGSQIEDHETGFSAPDEMEWDSSDDGVIPDLAKGSSAEDAIEL